jgi:hypothetical protein
MHNDDKMTSKEQQMRWLFERAQALTTAVGLAAQTGCCDACKVKIKQAMDQAWEDWKRRL